MIAESTPRTPPSRWPVHNSRPAPASPNRTRRSHQVPRQPHDWLPYAILGSTALLIGGLATVVVVLAR